MSLWKRLLGREEEPADPFGREEDEPGPAVEVRPEPAAGGHGEPIVSFQSAPTEATWTSVTVNGRPVPPEQADAFRAAFEQLGNVASLGASQVIDLRGVPGLRDAVLGAMREHVGDPAALQGAVLRALREHGVAAGSIPPPSGSPQAAQPDPVDRLRELGELRDQGVLTEAEFEAQKKRLLGEL
jgi:Short C-terminal domain